MSRKVHGVFLLVSSGAMKRRLFLSAAGAGLAVAALDGLAIAKSKRPLRLLILGGTRFIGLHMTELALARGHTLTFFNRGRTNTDRFPEVERLREIVTVTSNRSRVASGMPSSTTPVMCRDTFERRRGYSSRAYDATSSSPRCRSMKVSPKATTRTHHLESSMTSRSRRWMAPPMAR